MQRRNAIWGFASWLLVSYAIAGCSSNDAPARPAANNQNTSTNEKDRKPVNMLTAKNTVVTEVEVKQGEEVKAPRVIEVKSLKQTNGGKVEASVSQGKDGLSAKVILGEEYIGIIVSATMDAKPGVQDLTITTGNSTDTLRVTVKAAGAK